MNPNPIDDDAECDGCGAVFSLSDPEATHQRITYTDLSGYDDYGYCPACTKEQYEAEQAIEAKYGPLGGEDHDAAEQRGGG